jgi:hypothetical protein
VPQNLKPLTAEFAEEIAEIAKNVAAVFAVLFQKDD